jgi:hypothetical protein
MYDALVGRRNKKGNYGKLIIVRLLNCCGHSNDDGKLNRPPTRHLERRPALQRR